MNKIVSGRPVPFSFYPGEKIEQDPRCPHAQSAHHKRRKALKRKFDGYETGPPGKVDKEEAPDNHANVFLPFSQHGAHHRSAFRGHQALALLDFQIDSVLALE